MSYSVYLNHMWALLLSYAVLSRIADELVFYRRWPYYTGAFLDIINLLSVYYLVEKPALAYLGSTYTRKWAMPQVVTRALANLQLKLLQRRPAPRKVSAVPARDWSGLTGREAAPASLPSQELTYQAA